ncbi:integrase domain-containing protein [Pseudomonas syringae]|uniref:integrase domain-containing protein n=1 Tax=Pseudomonas syringae TaxID=317 RepID=UPI003F7B30DA
MALVGRRDGRKALKDIFGGGHYGTVKAHCDRWQASVKWCRSEQGPGINDARQIDRKVLADYAAYLREVVRRGDLAVSTAQNRLSSVNRTMAALRGDQNIALPSPSKSLGMQRTRVRRSVPQGQNREQVKQIVDALCSRDQLRAAAIVLLARATGMRLREAILADLPRLRREANDLGRINIQDGTKSGRAGVSAPCWISVDNNVRGALGFAWQVSPAGSRNMIAPHANYLNVLQDIIRPAWEILHAHNLNDFHELRAAYACERYEQITRHRAPINGSQCCQVDSQLDRGARRQISYELGHARIDVVAAYIGGRA